MTLIRDWIIEQACCAEGLAWFDDREETDILHNDSEIARYIEELYSQEHYRWATWLILKSIPDEDFSDFSDTYYDGKMPSKLFMLKYTSLLPDRTTVLRSNYYDWKG